MQRNLKRWLAVGVGAIAMALLVLWLPGCQAPASKEAAKTTEPNASSGHQTAPHAHEGHPLDPSKSEDIAQAKSAVKGLLEQAVGKDAGPIEVTSWQGGFAIEARMAIVSLDKQRIHDVLQEIYRSLADQFPGHITQAQVAIIYIAGYQNGQAIKKLLVTTFMRDKLYQKDWGDCPWDSPFYDKDQLESIPCVRPGQPPPA